MGLSKQALPTQLPMFKKLFPSKSTVSSARQLDNIFLDGVEFSLQHTVRKNMKRMLLRVDKKNHIRLSSSGASKKRLEAFIYENRTWILQQQEKIKEPFERGALFYHFAKVFVIEHHSNILCIRGEKIYLDYAKAKTQSDEFYKQSAKEYLPLRVEYWKQEMKVEFNALNFRLAKRRWGSCNSKKNITLNPYMMKLSKKMIDYIIVHELAHLIHLNHSKAFYKIIEVYIPDYKTIEAEIKRLSLEIT